MDSSLFLDLVEKYIWFQFWMFIFIGLILFYAVFVHDIFKDTS